MSVWVLVCADLWGLHLCLFGCHLKEGTGRFVRGKLVYWPLNRLNEEESGRGQGKETMWKSRGDFSPFGISSFSWKILNSAFKIDSTPFIPPMADKCLSWRAKDKERDDKRETMERWRRRGIRSMGTVGLLKAPRTWCERRAAKTQRGRSGIPLTQTSTPTHSGNGFITEPPLPAFTHPWSQTLRSPRSTDVHNYHVTFDWI